MTLERYLVDSPITVPEEDEIGLDDLVGRLYKTLVHWPSGESFVVGLFGGWGSGKSSTLNLLRKRLKKDTQAIVVTFDPWLHADPTALTLAFFESLAEKLRGDARIPGFWQKRRISKALDSLATYVAIAASATPTGYSTAGALLARSAERAAKMLARSATDVVKHRARVSDQLRSLADTHKTRVVYLIDDLDRLTPNEILNVLKLVRHVAALPNITYVLAMDDSVVRAQLKKSGHEAGFLEKFVQVTVRMPAIATVKRAGLIRTSLAHVAAASGYNVEASALLASRGKYGFLERIARDHLTTLRDRSRIANTLRVILAGAASDEALNLEDSCLLAITSVVWPEMFRRIQDRREFLVDGRVFDLTLAPDDRADQKIRAARLVAFGDSEEEGQPLAIEMLAALFPAVEHGVPSEDQYRKLRRENRICVGDRFDWYFYSVGPHSELSDALIEEVLTKLQVEVQADEEVPPRLRDFVDGLTSDELRSFEVKLGDRIETIQTPAARTVLRELLALQGTLNEEFLVDFADRLANRFEPNEDQCGILVSLITELGDALKAADVADDLVHSRLQCRPSTECSARLIALGLDRIGETLGTDRILRGEPGEAMHRIFTWERLLRAHGTNPADQLRLHLPAYVADDIALLPNLIASAVNIWSGDLKVPLPERGGWQAVAQGVDDRIGLDSLARFTELFLGLDEAAQFTADPHGLVQGLQTYLEREDQEGRHEQV